MIEKRIEKILVTPKLKQRKRVAAYVRVSVDKETMLHSFTAQASYYKELISKHKDWLFVDVYADYGISGTKVNRPEFNRMIDDCKAGKIDMIITKSISRFARNTTLLLSTIRELKALNIDVYFEEQNINSMSEQGELMLTLLASIAEAEAKSMGENVKWRINKTFEQGEIYNTTRFYGYDIIDKKFIINEKQASVVRRIFQMVLDGFGYIKIIEVLNKENIKSPSGSKWTIRSLERIIKEDTYTGKLTLQKTYRAENHTKKRNLGELRKYIVEDNHEAIIDRDTFNKVQEIIALRRNKAKGKYDSNDLFKGMIRCSICGASYQRKKRYGYNLYDWRCWNYLYSPKDERCKTVGLPESILIEKTKEALEVDELTSKLVKDKIKVIFAHPNRVLEFVLNDGTKKTIAWELKSRKYSWTPELREEARLRAIKRKNTGRKEEEQCQM